MLEHSRCDTRAEKRRQAEKWMESREIAPDAAPFARRSDVRDADSVEHLEANRWRLFFDEEIRERRVPAALERWCRSKPSPANLEDADQDGVAADTEATKGDRKPLPSEEIEQPWRREQARKREQEARH